MKSQGASVPNSEQVIDSKGRTAELLAEKAGIGKSTMQDALTVDRYGTEKQKRAVIDGTEKVSVVAKEVRQENKSHKQYKSVFNKTTDSIEWAKWTWNPVTGCRHGCPYCYAYDIAMRFNGHFRPTFHSDRLSAPKNTKNPNSSYIGDRNVFVCSMADLFGEWVPQEWIDAVLDSIRKSPQWNYIFLTKNPERYLTIDFPENCWIGATADTQDRCDKAKNVFNILKFQKVVTNPLFLSCEPMSEPIILIDKFADYEDPSGKCLRWVDWIIIGGRSETKKMPESQPKWQWVESLHNEAREMGCMVYWKPNLKIRPKEYPEK